MLESYLSKLRCSGPLTGNKCPKIEWCGKWILDLLANKTCRAKEESHRRALVRCCVLPICLQQLHYQNYLSQFQWSERRTFLSNQCKIEMHYLYQISRMQLSFVASLAMNSLKKNTSVARCYTPSPFLFFEGKLIGFSGYLAFTCQSDSILKRERKIAYLISASKYSLNYKNYLSQFQWSERRTFLSNQCKIEMHYLYQISRMQLSFVASLAMNSLKKNTSVARCYTPSPFLFFEGKLIGFSGYLAFTCQSDSILKRERKIA